MSGFGPLLLAVLSFPWRSDWWSDGVLRRAGIKRRICNYNARQPHDKTVKRMVVGGVQVLFRGGSGWLSAWV